MDIKNNLQIIEEKNCDNSSLQLSKIDLNEDYCNEWNIRINDFIFKINKKDGSYELFS
jgi:hypothetical protein